MAFSLRAVQNLHFYPLFGPKKVFSGPKKLKKIQKIQNFKISKFESIKLIPASKASNSYEKDTQATYKPSTEVYFITYNNQTFEFDGKQKSLEKIIPGKTDAIKAFYKQNKIKENDSDMIKLGNFLATI